MFASLGGSNNEREKEDVGKKRAEWLRSPVLGSLVRGELEQAAPFRLGRLSI